MSGDAPDLYPPDVDVVTKDMKTTRMRAAFGTALVTLGSGLMLERMVDRDLDYFWMAVGFGLIAAWLQVPRFPWFAVGSIMNGFAIGGFIESLISAPFESTIEFLCAAGGFFAVYVRYPRTAKWAIVPAAIFAFLAVSSTGVELIGLIPGAVTSMLLPLLLIAGGALLLFRNSLPRMFVKCGLIVLAISFVGAAASTVDKWDTDHGFDWDFRGRRVSTALPDIEGRTVVLDCPAGSIRVLEGDVPSVSAQIRGARQRLHVEETATKIILQTEAISGPTILPNVGLTQCEATLPRGTDVEATTNSGDIEVEFGGGDGSYRTLSGSIDVTVLDAGEGELDAETISGDIEIDLDDAELDPTFDLRTQAGEIEVGNEGSGREFSREGSALVVTAKTTTGDITVDND